MYSRHEEIVTGLAKCLAQFDGKLYEDLPLETQGTYLGRAMNQVAFLCSRGCVLKVERELPIPTNPDARRRLEQLVEAGFHATEPLIEEVE